MATLVLSAAGMAPGRIAWGSVMGLSDGDGGARGGGGAGPGDRPADPWRRQRSGRGWPRGPLSFEPVTGGGRRDCASARAECGWAVMLIWASRFAESAETTGGGKGAGGAACHDDL